MLQSLAPSLRRILVALGTVAYLTQAMPCQAQAAAGLSALDSLRTLVTDGRGAEAEPKLRALLGASQAGTSTDSLWTAQVLDLLVQALLDTGRAGEPEVRQLCERALRLKRERFGDGSAEYAETLFRIGRLEYDQGAYATADSILTHVLDIRTRSLPMNDPEIAATLVTLGAVRSDRGDQAGARKCLEHALAIRETAFGSEAREVAECLNSLAAVLHRTGNYAEAAPAYQRALLIWSKTRGPESRQVATCLHNMGNLDLDLGDFASAQVRLEEALRVRLKTLGPDHEYVANTLTSLAAAVRANGDLPRAQELYERALASQEKRYGPDHEEVGWILSRLGFVMIQKGEIDRARTYLERARKNLESGLGGDHPDVAEALVGLAVVASARGDSAAAAALFARALAIQEQSLGPDHPEIAITLGEWARARAGAGDWPGAEDAALRAAVIEREHIRLTARSLVERQALAFASFRSPGYAASRPPGLELALSILERDPSRSPEIVTRVWDQLVRSRALVLDEVASRNRTVSGVSRAARALDESRQRLANLMVRGPQGESSEAYRTTVQRAREEAEQAERALAEQSVAFRIGTQRDQAGLSEVESSLPPRSALVAYARSGSEPEEHYLAFVVAPRARQPRVISLGSAGSMDRAVARWADEAGRGTLRPERSATEGARAYQIAGDELRRRLWDPIAGLLEGAARIFIVPEGSLHLVNFACLPQGDGAFLAERAPLIHNLSTERDLIPTLDAARAEGLLAVGGPVFDGRPILRTGRTSTSRSTLGASGGFRGAAPDCEDFRKIRFGPLPESVREVREIRAIWRGPGKARLLTGSSATESAFRRLAPGRRVLHLATHGFVLAGRCASASPADGRGIGGLAGGGAPVEAPSERDVYDNPLLLSGLALAGANERNRPDPSGDDGILTAEEIASMDLAGSEWVVLSACDTGLGEIRTGEGVLGLERAFRAAGAGTLIMSLWAVEDRSTREWMRDLYQSRFRDRMGTAEAVRAADLEVLRARRARGESTHPFYWAAFVAAGNWR